MALRRATPCFLLAFAAGMPAHADQPPDGPAAASAGVLSPAVIAASNAHIGRITIDNGSIFDLDNPLEDKLLYRFANRAHVTTRPDVIEGQLLFHPGDRFSMQELEETERLLRTNRYLQDATVEPVRYENGLVDVNVSTTDVWTLMPKLALSRSGGENSSAVGLKEMNLLGSGMAVEVLYKSDVDRDSSSIKIVDRNFGGSWYTLAALYAINSDGYSKSLSFEQPFYSLNSRDARGISFADVDEIGSFYDQGEKLDQYRHLGRNQEFKVGWSKGLVDGWARRYTVGIAYDDHRFTSKPDSEYPSTVVPEDRRLLYPFVGIEFVQDRYEEARNHDQINRVEDRYLGTSLSATLGLARADAGSDRDAWLFNAAAQKGFGSSEASSLILASDLTGRLEDDGVQNLTLDLSARYYKRQSERRLLYVELTGTYGDNLDLDQYLLLGGDSGLRGYPLRYQTGDRRALLSLEQRYFTDWYPFRLFRVGGAVFFDVGRAWGNAPVTASDNEWLRDVGIGLRIGHTRSGLGRMTHIDLAFPLDGNDGINDVQFLVTTKKSF